MKKLLLVFLSFLVLGTAYYGLEYFNITQTTVSNKLDTKRVKKLITPPPQQKILSNNYHVYQTFNNCGPAAFSMALSYFSITESQEKLGQDLRPYQNPQGDNDDKSVTLDELAEKSKEYNLIPYHRPNGDMEKIKLFISYDLPVITRTWLKENDDIGHYRIIKGYDGTNIIQDDSLQGKNLIYSSADFEKLWEKYNYEYLVLVPKEKKEIAEAILEDDKNEKKSWEKAVRVAETKIKDGANETVWRFNLSIALFNSGRPNDSALEFEKIENRLNKRALWYQIEPIKAYYEIGNYQKVLSVSEKVLNNQNRAYSELYVIRGKTYEKLRNSTMANAEFEKARFYNKNLRF